MFIYLNVHINTLCLNVYNLNELNFFFTSPFPDRTVIEMFAPRIFKTKEIYVLFQIRPNHILKFIRF